MPKNITIYSPKSAGSFLAILDENAPSPCLTSFSKHLSVYRASEFILWVNFYSCVYLYFHITAIYSFCKKHEHCCVITTGWWLLFNYRRTTPLGAWSRRNILRTFKHVHVTRGKFGTVYRCQEKTTGLQLAAKFIPIPKRDDRRNVEREVEIMNSLQHPLIIQLYDAFEYQKMMCVVLEL